MRRKLKIHKNHASFFFFDRTKLCVAWVKKMLLVSVEKFPWQENQLCLTPSSSSPNSPLNRLTIFIVLLHTFGFLTNKIDGGC